MKRTLEYLPALVAFLAVVMGISTNPKWDSTQTGLRHVTRFGWATVGVGIAALVASVIVTRKRQKDLERQTSQRDHLRRIAHADVWLALRQITWPFFSLFGDEANESDLQLVPPHIEDPSRLASVMKIDIRSKTHGLSGSTFDVSWAEVLEENAARGAARIDRAMQIYAAYLEPEILEALSELQTSEFLVLRLHRLAEFVQTNTHVGFLEFPFVNAPDISDCFGFGQFWKIIRKLDQLLSKDPDRIRRGL